MGLQANLGKINVMFSGGITKNGLSKSNVDQRGGRSLTGKANSDLCVQCGKWIHS